MSDQRGGAQNRGESVGGSMHDPDKNQDQANKPNRVWLGILGLELAGPSVVRRRLSYRGDLIL